MTKPERAEASTPEAYSRSWRDRIGRLWGSMRVVGDPLGLNRVVSSRRLRRGRLIPRGSTREAFSGAQQRLATVRAASLEGSIASIARTDDHHVVPDQPASSAASQCPASLRPDTAQDGLDVRSVAGAADWFQSERLARDRRTLGPDERVDKHSHPMYA